MMLGSILFWAFSYQFFTDSYDFLALGSSLLISFLFTRLLLLDEKCCCARSKKCRCSCCCGKECYEHDNHAIVTNTDKLEFVKIDD